MILPMALPALKTSSVLPVASARILDAAEAEFVDVAPDVPNNIATELLEKLLTDEIIARAPENKIFPGSFGASAIADRHHAWVDTKYHF